MNRSDPPNARLAAEVEQGARFKGELAKLGAAKTRLSNKIGKLAAQLESVAAERQAEVARHEALRREHDALRSAHAKLAEENSRLKADAEASSQAVGTHNESCVPYAEFSVRAQAIFGRTHFKSAFAFHGGITVKQMNAFQAAGFIPAEIAMALETMTEAQRRPASRKRWTDDELGRLMELLYRGDSALAIAKTLSCEFGRPLYEKSITGRRRRLVRDRIWTPPAGARGGHPSASTLH